MSSPEQEPIAIVGMGCRFPGAPNPRAFWQLLRDGVDAVVEVPPARWDIAAFYDPNEAVQGKMVSRWGGFLDGVDRFDPEFFGISPREAERMDPQQRLVLEVAWEALEDAGIAPHRLRGSDTGVFIGIGNTDYTRMLCHDVGGIDRYDGTGGTLSFAANRLSYFLDLHGPSLGMESACSSSLVALHIACRSLRDGESSLAVAGGVNLVLTPDMTVAFSQARMMSPTGRCRAFDAAADGYVRGEGCGALILKRRADALRDGDRILALIRGSAMNQDGTSNGITAPNGSAQQALIRRACANAGIKPARIGYIEAHGTGTKVGDPIEIRALKNVLLEDRPADAICRIGSVKTNIGHLEAAAGIAGLIKTVLVLQHKQIPPHLHLNELNPYLSLAGTPLEIPRTLQAWNSTDTRFAGVSGFSFGGTNCHVILEEAADAAAHDAADGGPHLLPLAARSAPALRDLAAAYAERFRTEASIRPADVCFTAAQGRSPFPHRLAVVGRSPEEFAAHLSGWLDGDTVPGLAHHVAPRHQSPDVVFLFTGQGSRYPGMARQLYDACPRFRQMLTRCEDVLRALKSPCTLEHILGSDASGSDDAAIVQPALFALEVALADLWRSWGVVPKAVIGHSLGEYAAACVAGVFSLEDGLALVAERGRLVASLSERGTMAALFAPAEQVDAALRRRGGRAAIAAINGPRHTVIAGAEDAVAAVVRDLAGEGIESQPLKTSHAFHSPLMEPLLAPFEAAAAGISHARPALALACGLSGAPWRNGEGPDAGYWRRHLVEPVQFLPGLLALASERPRIFLEIGPGSALARMGKRCGLGEGALFLPSLLPERDERDVMLSSLAVLYTQGIEIDWAGVFAGADVRPVSLPTYPFQRQSYWYADVSQSVADAPPPATVLPAPKPAPVAEQGEVLDILRRHLAKLLRCEASAIDVEASFLELGADSLVLVDAVHQFEQVFGVKVSVKQLFDEMPTPKALANHISARRPAAPPAAEPLPPRAETARDAAGQADTSSLARLMEQQLRIIEQQLRILSGQTAAALSPAPVSVVPAVANPAPIAVPPASALAPGQQRYLAALAERYVARTQSSRERAGGARPVLADSRASAGFRPSIKEMLYPIVGARAEGAHFWDVDGNQYVDISMGFGVLLFGHQPAFVTQALEAQWHNGLQIGPQSPLAGDVAALVRDLTGVERVAFCNSGTEAVMTALRLARTATGRRKVAVFAGAYHGHSDGVLAAATAVASSAGVTAGAVADIVVLEYGAPGALEILESCADELAAVLVEPVQSRNPDLQPREFLHRLRAITQKSGAALVFDEILTGFRIHPGGAQAWFEVQADIVTYGKIAGGGLPIGIVAGAARYLDGIDGGQWRYGDATAPRAETTFFAGTFNKNHLGMAAARAVLSHLKAAGPGLQEALNARTAKLAATLNAHLEAENVPMRVARFGSLFRFQFSENLDAFFYALAEKGIYIWEGRTCFLSTAHSDEDVERVIAGVKASIADLKAAGWFGGHTSAIAAPALPDAAAIGDGLQGPLAQLRARHDIAAYEEGIAALDGLAAAYIHHAFARLGHRWRVGEVFSSESLAAALGVVAAQRKLFGRLLQILGEEGDLVAAGPDRWRVARETQAADPARQAEDLKQRCAGVRHELAMLERCGAALAEALRGTRHPLELLFPGGDLGPSRELYMHSPMARTMNTLLQQAVAAAVAAAPDGARLRLLEVGAGTGGSTAYVVPGLPAERVEYVFSDVSQRFLDMARAHFAAHPFISYRLLDIERAPKPDDRADIVIAANVVHATADLGTTLRHLHQLVRPGGLLFVLEGTGRARWLDLVFGLTDGWWRFADHVLRADHPLLAAGPWRAQLEAAGFSQIVALSSNERPRAGEQTLLVASRARRLPLSEAQHAIWVLSQMSPDASVAYNESITIALRGALDRTALQEAVRRLVARHEALRLTIGADGNHQTVGAGRAALAFVDLGTSDAGRWVAAEIAVPFDLEKGPLARFHLLELADDLHWLVVVAHHIVIDGQSLATLARELGALYSALSNGRADELPPAPQFGAYLENQRTPAGREAQAAAQDYWLRTLAAPLPRTELALDRPRPAVQSHAGARLRRDMDGELAERLAAAASGHGCTLFMLLLAGLDALLRIVARADEVVVGISSAGQNAQGDSAVVGYCVNVLPLRLKNRPGDRFRDLLATVRGAVLDAFEHQSLVFSRLVAELGLRRDPGRPPLIDVHFNYDKVEAAVAFDALDVTLTANLSGAVRRDLTWNPVETGGRLTLICDYNTDLFDAATVEGWMADYEWILDMVVRQPDLSLAALAEGLAAAKAGRLKVVSGSRLRQARRKGAGEP